MCFCYNYRIFDNCADVSAFLKINFPRCFLVMQRLIFHIILGINLSALFLKNPSKAGFIPSLLFIVRNAWNMLEMFVVDIISGYFKDSCLSSYSQTGAPSWQTSKVRSNHLLNFQFITRRYNRRLFLWIITTKSNFTITLFIELLKFLFSAHEDWRIPVFWTMKLSLYIQVLLNIYLYVCIYLSWKISRDVKTLHLNHVSKEKRHLKIIENKNVVQALIWNFHLCSPLRFMCRSACPIFLFKVIAWFGERW